MLTEFDDFDQGADDFETDINHPARGYEFALMIAMVAERYLDDPDGVKSEYDYSRGYLAAFAKYKENQ